MGLPLTLTCCVNVNDIVHRTIANGDFSITTDVKASYSSAMDIQVGIVKYNIMNLLDMIGVVLYARTTIQQSLLMLSVTGSLQYGEIDLYQIWI